MKSIVHAVEKPQEIQYTVRKDGMADVWLRRNIAQQPCHSDGGGETTWNMSMMRSFSAPQQAGMMLQQIRTLSGRSVRLGAGRSADERRDAGKEDCRLGA